MWCVSMIGKEVLSNEWNPCSQPYNPSHQDEEEIVRQGEILKGVFHIPQYTSDPMKVSILAGVEAVVSTICQSDKPIENFLHFQDSVINLSEYAFLSETYPGLNVNGWRIFLAKIDPLTYGRQIHRTSKGTSGKRI